MGIHHDTLAKKPAGERKITVDDINGIAKAGGFSADEFVSFKDAKSE